ncbi:MAG: NADH-quinone oxidoreductase subunit N [Candidatus Limisoma sp.]|nr:NADH-quinone oxidoreductase subunit N [Muribaculaceae bacterium]MDY4941838.1 NADH-quinone oxidoreductase subunit N [Candidatus Limisoma sp.]MDY5899862.1 NADH-quinone oxidoreductase subunit N [Candidatus Limisoma sp.]MDY6105517.1 NADH-quinone oxidoreductase subunit N [Candidatus Limisoma sp.]
MNYSEFLVMHQEIGLLIVFLLVFLFDTFLPKGAQNKLTVFATALFGAFTIGSFFLPMHAGQEVAFGGMFVTSSIVMCIKNILNIGLFLVLIQSIKWNDSEHQAIRRGEFIELLMLTLFGMYLMVSARHFLVFIIGLETASLPLAALVAFEKNRYESHEAAVKYLFTAVFSSAIYMLGLSFVYGVCGSLYFSDIATRIVAAEGSALLFVALAFVIAGIGFKISMVPFHLWTADVYEGAPTSVTSYLSVVSKGAATFAAFIILTQAFGTVYSQVWEWMLYALIILTITIGNLFAIRQNNLKRFLAFSSISQAGYIMLGVVANAPVGVAALSYYVLVYIFSNLAAFGVIQAVENASGKLLISDYNGLYKTNPRLSFAMMLAMFSLGGIPPFAGFFSKFFIFSAALQEGSVAMYVLVLIALINTIVSLYYYLLVVKAMFINTNDAPIASFKSHWSERAGLLICVAGILVAGLISSVYVYLNAAAGASMLF